MANAQLSEYERQRQENISQLQNEFSDLFENVEQSTIDLAKSTPSSLLKNVQGRRRNNRPWNKIKIGTKRPAPEAPTVVRRSARIINEQSKVTNYNEGSDDNEKLKKAKKGSIIMKFSWYKSIAQKHLDKIYYSGQKDNDFVDDDDDDEDEYDSYEPRPKRKRTTKTFIPRYPISQITQEMLNNIVYCTSLKVYGKTGTTCHQCRQKTLDQKSCCRHKQCIGVRGMFCGFCLGHRYGEDVAKVLKDPKWACPPCRGYCNCSICRRKQGLNPTGQLSQIALANGYKSVKDFLSQIEGETCNKFEDADYNDEGLETDNLKDSNDNIEDENKENRIEVKPTKKVLLNFCCNNNNKDCKYHIEEGDDSQTIIDKYYMQLFSGKSRVVFST